MEKQKRLTEMKVIPFRTSVSKEEDSLAEVYSFLIKGTSKNAYEIEIEIDNANDLGLTDTRCTCPHYTFRQIDCKHIILCKKILNEFGINTDIVQIAKGDKNE